MPRSLHYVPKLRLHKQSGQAIVTLNYRDYTLGKHGTPAATARYHELVARWLANGRQPLEPLPPIAGGAAQVLTVRHLFQAFCRARQHYSSITTAGPTAHANGRDVGRLVANGRERANLGSRESVTLVSLFLAPYTYAGARTGEPGMDGGEGEG